MVGVLEGKVAIVTGAAQGIGRGVARALAKEGATVVAVDWNGEGAQSAAAEIQSLGARATAVQCDVSRADDVARVVVRAVEAYGAIDVLVNAAQASKPQTPFEEHRDEDFAMAVDTGLWGTFRLMRECFPHLRGRDGRIVNFASSTGTHGQPGFAGYAAAKEGIRGLTKVAANEWGRHGVTVNAVCPAAMTPATEGWAAANPDRYQASLQGRAIPREGDPEADIGRAVVFLAGPDASFITGQTLMVNGGRVTMP